jgi:UDP-N-acetylglucosamine diphosphorylase/glucosamine-1-phosphate N-acetyltransferase
MSSTLTTIIMAGGLGKRMNSDLPKVLHLVKGRPMICHVIDQAFVAGSQNIIIIVGKYKDLIQHEISKHYPTEDYFRLTFIKQGEPKGTGHAVNCCLDFFITEHVPPESNVLVLSGDVPLIKQDTIQSILRTPNTVLITELENPKGCGRILFSENLVHKIIEEKDCNEEERTIKYVNCGIYNLTVNVLESYVPMIENKNASQEFYLTDIVEIAALNGNPLHYYELPEDRQCEIININTQAELEAANQLSL